MVAPQVMAAHRAAISRPMIVGIGSDIVDVERIRKSWHNHAERFLNRVFSPAEQTYCLAHKDPAERMAGRWAAKEALLKAMGSGLIGKMHLYEIEITNNNLGAPLITLTGAVQEYVQQLGIDLSIWCTISHAAGVATSTVILEQKAGSHP